jgi:hypothetical protein
MSAAFDRLAELPRWVAWRNEERNGRLTKVPRSPHDGEPAKADDPGTWGTRAEAETRARRMVMRHGGGIGIELGDLRDGTSLGGIDLDTGRREDGAFEPWARDIIDRFASYTEISPSGTGAKIFFLYRTDALPTIREAMGGPKHGREFKRGNGKDHPPAIELHLSNRYFTVTEQKLDDVPDTITAIPTDLLLWVLQEAGPAFAGTDPDTGASANIEVADTSRAGVALLRLDIADNSRSGVAFRKGTALVRSGATYEGMVEALSADPETAEWVRTKGKASGERELRRIWEKGQEALPGKKTDDLPQRDKLISIADRTEFWRCDEGLAHATIPVDAHHEYHRVRSQRFREWLIIEAGREYPVKIAGKTRPGTFGKNAVEDALSACEAMAATSRTALPARLRINQHDGNLYLDLGDPEWRAVEIGPEGWRIIDRPPVPILRTRRTRALPRPIAGGSLAPLRELLPLRGEDEWRIVILWALAALRPTGPYPILAWSGEQGTGKSFASRIMRRLIDPCGDDLMQPPREDRDLIAAARNNHVLAFDNLSSVSGELADSLCRLATGGDIGGRSLYTNDDSAAFAAQRPLLLNGIPDLASRGDLASRTLFVRLSPIRQRRPEAELWEAFNAVAPGILGALLDALSAALACLPAIRLPEDSADFRMADFALLAKAAEPALGWRSDAALNALRRNMRGAASMLADLDPVAIVIRDLIEDQPTRRFAGLVSGLYARLNSIADPEMKRAPGWPKGPPKLGEHLRRIAPSLRAVGIAFSEARSGAGVKVTIEARPDYVGKGDSLSESGEEEENGEPVAAVAGEVNSHPHLPTLPTRGAENGGIPGQTARIGGVGSVGTGRVAYTAAPQDWGSDRVGTGASAYTSKSLDSLSIDANGVAAGVGSVGDDSAAYTAKPIESQGLNPDHVGSVGKNPPKFTPSGSRRRIVL